MDTISEILINAKLFFQEIEDCGYTLEQPSIQFKKGERNLEKINKTIQLSKFPDLNAIIFKKSTQQEVIKYAREILQSLYPETYHSQIDPLFNLFRVTKLERFDGGIAGDYQVNDRTKLYNQAQIYSWKETYSSVILTHELTHAFLEQTLPPIGYNYNYNELCSIFADQYAATYLDKHLDTQNHLINYNTIRLWALQQNLLEYNNMRNYLRELSRPNDTLSPMELAYKYSYYNSYQYLISTIYAFQLFHLYLENPKQILSDFRKVITHELSIPNLLEKYQISLRDFNTVETTQQLILKHSIS